MEDDHPKLLAFAVGLIIALVLWIVMGGVSGILWDYMLLPACDGSLWAGKVVGVRSRDLQLGEALLASGVPDYLVPGALMGWPAEPLEWYLCNQPKTAAHFWQKEKWQIFSRLHNTRISGQRHASQVFTPGFRIQINTGRVKRW